MRVLRDFLIAGVGIFAFGIAFAAIAAALRNVFAHDTMALVATVGLFALGFRFADRRGWIG